MPGFEDGFLGVPARPGKPRSSGLTHVIDKGLNLRDIEGLFDTAGTFDWRLPEHYDEHWRPEPEAGRERPDDPFKPYGATVGHGLEWSRLLLNLVLTLPFASA